MKNNQLQHIFQSELVRNSSILISGNVIGQAIAFAALPLLTRLYSESDFGIFATFSSITGLLTIIGTGRYEESLIVAKNKKEMLQLLGFSLQLLGIFSGFLLLIFLFLRHQCLVFFQMEALSPYCFLIPFTVFFSGISFLLSNLATRERQFKSIAASGLIQNGVGTALKLGLGALSYTGIGLILANLLSSIAGVLPFYSLRKIFLLAWIEKRKEKWVTGIRYRTFPMHNLPRMFVSSFSLNLPFLCLITSFGNAQIGLFSLAFTLLHRPANLLSNALFTTFFEKSTSMQREGKRMVPILKKYCLIGLFLLLPCCLIAYYSAPIIVEILFGKNWIESAIYFRYLLPWIGMSILSAPFQYIPVLFNKQGQALCIEGLQVACRWLALLAGIYVQDFRLSILLFALVSCLFCLVQLIWYYKLIAVYDKNCFDAFSC